MTPKPMNELLQELEGKPILVANRGIPARRICRSIRERFHATAIMTATDVDKTSPAVASAQELMLLGSDPTAYLDLDLIISKAKKRGVVAIHPGWGFASENVRKRALFSLGLMLMPCVCSAIRLKLVILRKN